MTIGFILTAFALFCYRYGFMQFSYLLIGISLFFIGFGISLTIPSLMTAVISATSKEQVGIVSGALNSIRQVGAVLGVAAIVALLNGSNSFTEGLHRSLFVISGILIVGGMLSFSFIKRN